LSKEDFSQKGAIFLRPEAQFDYLVSLPDSAKRDRAIQHAMDTRTKNHHRRGSEWRRKDVLRTPVPAAGGRVPGVHQRRPDCRRPVPLSSGSRRITCRQDVCSLKFPARSLDAGIAKKRL
jgi:hypothetical protein